MIVNLGVGYRPRRINVGLDILKLLDSDNHDIDYFYTSTLAGESVAGSNDVQS